MRIGVLGGTFDPPHLGHLALADAAIDQLELDELIFMPANRNPIKDRTVATAAKDRLGMVAALIAGAGSEKLAYSDLELTRPGPSYTVDSMTELQMAQPADYWFVLGADALKTLPEWKQPQRLVKLCRLAVAIRPPTSVIEVVRRVPEEFQSKIDTIQMEPMDVSSTVLRQRVTRGVGVSEWIPPGVLKYIRTHRLYEE